MVNIVLADDHQMVRKGLRALLCSEADFNIVGEAGDGLEALDLVKKLQPEILVLDLMMPGINGLEVIRQITRKNIKTGVVVLSMHNNEAYVLEALRSGAKAYILKESPAEELVHAIREVGEGRRYLSSPLSEKSIDSYLAKAEVTNFDPFDALTAREQEIFQLATQGFSNNDIASKLNISHRTVETHRTNLMHKLGLHSHTQLVQYAITRGLISPVSNQVNSR
jgi:DNA-binding NarL/FixJ family response regulator